MAFKRLKTWSDEALHDEVRYEEEQIAKYEARLKDSKEWLARVKNELEHRGKNS